MHTILDRARAAAPATARSRSVIGEALTAWLLTRAGVALLAAGGAWYLNLGRDAGHVERWMRWDAVHFMRIARWGYDGDPDVAPDPGLPAFFPGFPLLLRAVHTVIGDWTLAGLLISLAAGAVAVCALARLADEGTGPRALARLAAEGTGPRVLARLAEEGTGSRAVWALLLAPPAVFLFAGYSEALFLAFALPAWLLAGRDRWAAAATCAAFASSVRVTGLYLAVALAVRLALAWRAGRVRPRTAGWLALPFLPLAAYSFYQWTRTGDWLAWQSAQKAGWGRELTWPWEAWQTSWDAAWHVDNAFTWAFRGELAAAVIGVALTAWLAHRRLWPECVYVGLQVAALTTSTYYMSIPRSMLLWFPLWLLLARAPRRIFLLYAAVSIPLAVLHVLMFANNIWAG
ncbi:mannosyltransferase family protein [Nonomuraea sediminis]|uniref:mannosyltransferase family protein n=1 Tax=Nonomuraea sediminis TaxID=2835864 RepID=UPI001BDD0907|nr:mannosyltransferase family protein [Nonomuraea sediminis]